MSDTTSDSFVTNCINNFKSCLSKYVTFSGRASRSEYWLFALVQFILTAIAQLIDGAIGSPIMYTIVFLALALPGLSVFVRRLHDVGRSGWWFFISFTFIGIFYLLYLLVKPTDAESNKYGEPAKPAC